jgi:hypothetical protein
MGLVEEIRSSTEGKAQRSISSIAPNLNNRGVRITNLRVKTSSVGWTTAEDHSDDHLYKRTRKEMSHGCPFLNL